MKPSELMDFKESLNLRAFNRSALVFCAVLLLFAVNSFAQVAIDDYKRRVREARSIAQELSVILSSDRPAVPSDEVDRRIRTVNDLINIGETVIGDGHRFPVDNSSISRLIDRFLELPEGDSLSTKRSLVYEMVLRLEAIDAQLERFDEESTGSARPEDRKKLEEILARPEFVSENGGGTSWLDWILQKIRELLDRMWPKRPILPNDSGISERGTYVFQILIYIALGLGAMFVLFRYGRFFVERIRGRVVERDAERVILGEIIGDEVTADELFAEAESMASNGDFTGAIRKGYVALLCELGDRRIVKLARHKTNRDYLREIRKRESVHGQVSGLTRCFEEHWYGLKNASSKDWEDFRQGYREAVSVGTQSAR